jgi:tRNA_anti-like
MENNNQSSVKTKNITFGLVFSWIFGVLFGIMAISTIFSEPLTGILNLLIAIILLPPCNRFLKNKFNISLSRGLKIFLVIVLSTILGTVMSKDVVTTKTSDQVATSTKEEIVVEPAIKVTATKLIADYKANEVSADAKYKSKIVEVSGLVDTIGKDLLDTPYIALSNGEQYSFEKVQCMFSKSNEAELANVTKGDRITLKGEVSGKLGNVLVRGCAIVK